MKVVEYYEKLKDICINYCKQGVEQDVLIGEFFKQFYETLKEQEKIKKRALSENEEEMIFNTQISSSSIDKLNETSDTLYIKDKNKFIVKSEFIDGIKKIALNCLANLLSFIIVLLITIYIFKKPIAEFLLKYISK